MHCEVFTVLRRSLAWWLSALLLAGTGIVFAQNFTAVISGTVTDASRAAIEGAKVSLTNAATGEIRTFTTSVDGRYTFTQLNPGTYSLAVSKPGFRQFVANDETPAVQSLPPAPPTRERERSPLSQREREIVALVAQGFKNKEMAEKMFISEQTVKNHLHNIFDKLGVSDRLELALYAIHNNLHTGR